MRIFLLFSETDKRFSSDLDGYSAVSTYLLYYCAIKEYDTTAIAIQKWVSNQSVRERRMCSSRLSVHLSERLLCCKKTTLLQFFVGVQLASVLVSLPSSFHSLISSLIYYLPRCVVHLQYDFNSRLLSRTCISYHTSLSAWDWGETLTPCTCMTMVHSIKTWEFRDRLSYDQYHDNGQDTSSSCTRTRTCGSR